MKPTIGRIVLTTFNNKNGEPVTRPAKHGGDMKPTIGRIVLTTFNNKNGEPVTRPAMIVRVWSDTCVNLRVFVDGKNDTEDGSDIWSTSATHVEASPGLGQWAWPPRV